jgi:hypothetical protein
MALCVRLVVVCVRLTCWKKLVVSNRPIGVAAGDNYAVRGKSGAEIVEDIAIRNRITAIVRGG